MKRSRGKKRKLVPRGSGASAYGAQIQCQKHEKSAKLEHDANVCHSGVSGVMTGHGQSHADQQKQSNASQPTNDLSVCSKPVKSRNENSNKGSALKIFKPEDQSAHCVSDITGMELPESQTAKYIPFFEKKKMLSCEDHGMKSTADMLRETEGDVEAEHSTENTEMKIRATVADVDRCTTQTACDAAREGVGKLKMLCERALKIKVGASPQTYKRDISTTACQENMEVCGQNQTADRCREKVYFLSAVDGSQVYETRKGHVTEKQLVDETETGVRAMDQSVTRDAGVQRSDFILGTRDREAAEESDPSCRDSQDQGLEIIYVNEADCTVLPAWGTVSTKHDHLKDTSGTSHVESVNNKLADGTSKAAVLDSSAVEETNAEAVVRSAAMEVNNQQVPEQSGNCSSFLSVYAQDVANSVCGCQESQPDLSEAENLFPSFKGTSVPGVDNMPLVTDAAFPETGQLIDERLSTQASSMHVVHATRTERMPLVVDLSGLTDIHKEKIGLKTSQVPLSALPYGASKKTAGSVSEQIRNEDPATRIDQPSETSSYKSDILSECLSELHAIQEFSEVTDSQLCQFEEEVEEASPGSCCGDKMMTPVHEQQLEEVKKTVLQNRVARSKGGAMIRKLTSELTKLNQMLIMHRRDIDAAKRQVLSRQQNEPKQVVSRQQNVPLPASKIPSRY